MPGFRFDGLFRRLTAFVCAVLVASGISYAAVKDWSTTAGSNGSILPGITLDGSVMTVPQVDNAFREMAAQIAAQLGKMGFKGTDVASASTTNLATATGWYVHITGTTAITALGTVDAGQVFVLEFDGALLLTHNASSLILLGGASITTAAGDIAVMVSEGSGNWRMVAYQTASGPTVGSAPLQGYINGLVISNNVADATNDIDIAVGRAGSDGSTPVLMVLGSALTKRLDASWAVGTNQGGLDTGSIANTTYHVFLIRRSDTGVVDALFSASATSPTMPTNYDQKRRIGSIVRTGGAIKAFLQDGNHFWWVTPVTDLSTLVAGTTAASRTLTLPTGVKNIAMVLGGGDDQGGKWEGLLSSLDAADIAPTTSAFNIRVDIGSTSDNIHLNQVLVRTNTSAQIRSRISLGGSVVIISTLGWIDSRGM